MPYLDTPYKRKSAVLTTIVMALVLLLIFTFGMTYFDPPKEYGIAVNFGTSDVGSGDTQPTEPLKSASAEEEVVEEVTEQEVEEVPEEVQETPTETAAEPAPAEKVITQDSEESIRIKKQEEAKRKAEAEEKRIRDAERQKKLEAERIEKQRKAAAEKKRKAQEAKRKKLDAMMGGLNNSNGTATGGEGNDNQAGDKGNPNGDPNASGYYGNGGGGSGGNYRLGNRRAVSKPKPTYDCNEEGRVVVSISVDKTGKVISARPGIKGTTNSAPCLLSRAKQAALKTRFNSDSKAPTKQVGSIIYNFSLSN
jgi:outer membrane biosynthesis protein TonB